MKKKRIRYSELSPVPREEQKRRISTPVDLARAPPRSSTGSSFFMRPRRGWGRGGTRSKPPPGGTRAGGNPRRWPSGARWYTPSLESVMSSCPWWIPSASSPRVSAERSRKPHEYTGQQARHLLPWRRPFRGRRARRRAGASLRVAYAGAGHARLHRADAGLPRPRGADRESPPPTGARAPRGAPRDAHGGPERLRRMDWAGRGFGDGGGAGARGRLEGAPGQQRARLQRRQASGHGSHRRVHLHGKRVESHFPW